MRNDFETLAADLGEARFEAARRARALMSRHSKARDLIQLGAYVPGHDRDLDMAVKQHPAMVAMLQQDMHLPARLEESVQQMQHIVE